MLYAIIHFGSINCEFCFSRSGLISTLIGEKSVAQRWEVTHPRLNYDHASFLERPRIAEIMLMKLKTIIHSFHELIIYER